MKKLISIACVTVLAMAAQAASAATWNFTNAGDYYLDGSASLVGGGAYVAPISADKAAVFARVDTQAHHLAVGDITGGGFTLSGMNNPTAVYGSLYLSPSGLGGSDVMINMSPMGRTGSTGDYVYSFDLNTPADVKHSPGGGNWSTADYTGTFGGAIGYVNASIYSNDYAAFFGPQIGMSGTSGTTFTVSQIQLAAPVPLPAAAWAGFSMLGGFGMLAGLRKKLGRRPRIA